VEFVDQISKSVSLTFELDVIRLKTALGCNSPWQPLEIPTASTPIGQLYQSLLSPVPGDLGRSHSEQSPEFSAMRGEGAAAPNSCAPQGHDQTREIFQLVQFFSISSEI